MALWTSQAVGAWWPATWFGLLVFWGLVIWGVMSLIRRGSRTTGPDRGEESARTRRSSAEDILAERFARGEIDEGEYLHRLDVLRSTPSPSDRRP